MPNNMSLDDAIQYYYNKGPLTPTCDNYKECLQLAEWLEELKERRVECRNLKIYVDQLMWERNVAIGQLESIGAQFGQKMDEFKKEGETK
jgi:hypothetical protein